MGVIEKHGGLVFRLKRVQGLSKKNQLWLKFGLNCDASLKAVPLDYVTECDKAEKGIEVSLPWLWERSETVPMGSFALIPSSKSIKVPGKAKWNALKAKLVKDKWYKKVNDHYTKRRRMIWEIMDEIHCSYNKNTSGMFVWAKIPEGYSSSIQFTDEILQKIVNTKENNL